MMFINRSYNSQRQWFRTCGMRTSSGTQSRINHWANRANARGLTLWEPRAWISKHSCIVFSCF